MHRSHSQEKLNLQVLPINPILHSPIIILELALRVGNIYGPSELRGFFLRRQVKTSTCFFLTQKYLKMEYPAHTIQMAIIGFKKQKRPLNIPRYFVESWLSMMGRRSNSVQNSKGQVVCWCACCHSGHLSCEKPALRDTKYVTPTLCIDLRVKVT